MTTSSELSFKRNYDTHLKHLRLKGLQPKTIDAYSRAILRIGAYFDVEYCAHPTVPGAHSVTQFIMSAMDR